ncbi:MAG: hypothetical protein IKL13_00450 [Clostridia bacterium]|nr:hypothetical protein [Clostridia bacterium]
MLVYKAMHPGQICRGVKLRPGLNIEPEANCAQNGWHAAEDPLDCLKYYPDEKNSELWVCEASGDIDEDNFDSKISCTHLTLIKRLSREEFVLHAIAYMLKHPDRREANDVYDHGTIHIRRGDRPTASGSKGDVIGLLRECAGRQAVAVFTIDGSEYMPGVEYTLGEEVVECA